jgi:hypothetical protein
MSRIWVVAGASFFDRINKMEKPIYRMKTQTDCLRYENAWRKPSLFVLKHSAV